jgi:surfactin synthase thioesterase subunit
MSHSVRTPRSDEVTMTAVVEDWFRRFHPAASAAARLLCFPHAGGSASYYHSLSASLAPQVESLVVQYPGRQDRRAESPVTDIVVLAEQIVSSFDPWQDRRPLALFGHSMGALVAYEVARRLERAPTVLIVSGKRAPSSPVPMTLHLLDDAGILAGLRTLSGTDEDVLDDEEIQRMILPALRADYAALGAYRWAPGPPLTCPITVLTGDTDPLSPIDEAPGWGAHTDAGLTVDVFRGGHFYLTGHWAAVTEAITRSVRGVT